MSRIGQHFPWAHGYNPYLMTTDGGEREIPCFEIVDDGGRRIAQTEEDMPCALQEANARLIASAPAMLIALEDQLEWLETGKADGTGSIRS